MSSPKNVARQATTHLKRLTHSSPYVWRLASRGRAKVNSARRVRSFDGVAGSFHPNDFMLRSFGGVNRVAAQAYVASGHRDVDGLFQRVEPLVGPELSALRWIEIGSGYGRIVRALVERVPPISVTAIDRLQQAVEFCRQQWGVAGALATPLFELDRRIQGEVTFAISVVTHVREEAFDAFLGLLDELVVPGGVALFSTHGRHSLDTLERYDDGAYEHLKHELTVSFERTGAAFTPYGSSADGCYGMAWLSDGLVRARVERILHGSFELVAFEPRGLDGHQDLWIYQRAAS